MELFEVSHAVHYALVRLDDLVQLDEWHKACLRAPGRVEGEEREPSRELVVNKVRRSASPMRWWCAAIASSAERSLGSTLSQGGRGGDMRTPLAWQREPPGGEH